jgi:hypothetical protein
MRVALLLTDRPSDQGARKGGLCPNEGRTWSWLLQVTKPRERDLRSFLEGPSYSGGTAAGAAVFIVTSPFANGAKVAIESGVGTPQAGVSGGTSLFAGKVTVGW